MGLFQNNKEIEKIIFRAELLATASGISIFEILEKYAIDLKKEDRKKAFTLSEISKKLRVGKKRWDVYKNIISKEILDLLKIAEEKSIPSGVIIKEYAPIKNITEKYINSVKSSLKSPLIIFILLSLIFSVVVEKFRVVDTIGSTGLSDASLFIMNNFLFITGIILVIMVYLFLAIPQKLPVLKIVFDKLNSMLALSMVATMFKIGYSGEEITPVMMKQFKLKKTKKRYSGAEELIETLRENKYLSTFESADIKIAISLGEFENSISSILKERLDDTESLKATVGEFIKNATTILLAIPILLAMFILADVMLIVTSMIGG